MNRKENFLAEVNNNVIVCDYFWTKGYANKDYNPHDHKLTNYFPTEADFKRYQKQQLKKVDNIVLKYPSLNRTQIMEEAITNPVLRATRFAIDPIRQRFDQRYQEKVIASVIRRLRKAYPGMVIENINNERNERFVLNNNGKLATNVGLYGTKDAYRTKTIDRLLHITYKGKTYNIFLFMKRTEESGGGQDDIAREVTDAYRKACRNSARNTFFGFILDGGYWKMNTIGLKNNDKVFRTTIDSFDNTLVEFLSRKRVI